jgi:putative ABC transport system permease protein
MVAPIGGWTLNDVRFAFRLLTRSPGFTTVAVLTLALGIGACAAIFSVVNGVLLHPLPVPEPERVVTIREALPGMPETAVAGGKFLAWQKSADSIESIGALAGMSYNLTGAGGPVHLYAARITAGVLSTLRLNPALGRNFLPEEEVPDGRENVAILSHGVWQRQFGGRPDILNRTIQLNGRPFTVVGVLPRESALPDRVEIFTPRGFYEAERRNYGYPTDHVFARLKPGVTLAAARRELIAISQRTALAAGAPGAVGRGWGLNVTPLMDSIVGKVRPVLVSLLGAVAFLLLIACANVANLLLARATSRSTEMAVRAAIGASRGRILRQLLVESLLLSLLGGVLGVAIAAAGLRLLLALAPDTLPRSYRIAVDARALGVTAALVVITAVGFGLAPAFQAARLRLNDALKSRRASGTGQRHHLRGALVVGEVAIALMLLAGAGLLMRSFARLHEVSPGFNPRNAHLVEIYLPRPQYTTNEQFVAFAERTRAEIATYPGVETVAVSGNIPFSDHHMTADIAVRISTPGGRPLNDPDVPVAGYYDVSPEYFRAMGIPLLRGRSFDTGDSAKARRVAIVSQSVAESFFPGQDPLGKSMIFGGRAPHEIVGVVGNVKHQSLEAAATLQIYEPYAQQPDNDIIYIVRTVDDAAGRDVPAAVRAAIARVDAGVPIYNARPMSVSVGSSILRQRFAMTLFAVFSAVALLLAAIGIYGVIGYSVSQRTGEIGIRMALGAHSGEVMRLVLVQGGRLIAVGVLAGVAGAWLLTRFLEKLVFNTSTHDPLTFVATVLLLTAIGGTACLLPARRATRVSPMTALRAE